MNSLQSILAAILLQLNPLVLPVSLAIAWLIRAGVGPEVDPKYRAPLATDNTDYETLVNFFAKGQPGCLKVKYLLACNRLGSDPNQPFAPDHPFYGVPLK